MECKIHMFLQTQLRKQTLVLGFLVCEFWFKLKEVRKSF